MLTLFICIGIAVLILAAPLGVEKYGVYLERDLALNALASAVDRDALLDAQTTQLAEHNADMNALLGIFADRVTVNQLSVRVGHGGRRLQPLDEHGRPLPRKGGGYYINGYPLRKAGDAEGYTFWAREQMTVKDFADSFSGVLSSDTIWVRDQLFAALFYNGAGYTFVDDSLGVSVTVYGLANGDTITYDKSTGNATDDHYSAQLAAIDDTHNPLDALYTEINEHQVNAGRVVAFISTGLEASISLLAGFAPVNTQTINIIPAAGSQVEEPMFAPPLNLPLSSTMRYIGTYKNMPIVVWDSIPVGPSTTYYIIPVAVDAEEKPLAYREYAQPSLQGLVNIGEPMSRFPYQNNNWVRAGGFGGKNRVGAAVARILNGTYAAPTGWSAPIG